MPVYFRNGNRVVAPLVRQLNRCDVCVKTGVMHVTPLNYDSERDARTTARFFGRNILTRTVPRLWTFLWQQFQCVNQQCPNKQPCGNQPVYLEFGSRTMQQARPPRAWVWVLYVYLVREIQCKAGEGGGGDVPPQTPLPPEPRLDLLEPEPSPPDVEPSPLPGPQAYYDPAKLYVPPQIVEIQTLPLPTEGEFPSEMPCG